MIRSKFLVLFVICIKFSSAQWVHKNPGTTDLISDVSFVTDQIGYAVDEHTGMLWKTTDGATNWNLINTSAGAWRIVFLTADTGFSVSATGLIKTTDGGNTWNQVVVPSNAGWWSRPIFFNHRSGISIQQNATSDSMIVMKTSDGGDTWHTIMERPDSLGAYIADISFPDSLTGYLVSETSMYKTTDGGFTWLLLQWRYPSYGSIYFTSPDTGFTYTDLDKFFRTDDGGMTWDSFPLPSSPYNGQVRFIDSRIGFICGGNGFSSGYVMKTLNGGATWTLDHTDNYTYFAFSFPANNVGYACGDGGTVIKSSIFNNVESNIQISPEISVSPNPFHSMITVRLLKMPNENSQIRCFDMFGGLVLQKALSSSDNFFDMSQLSTGLYTLIIQNQTDLETIKIVKEY
jgi:photosystem II stability/assembly factor-like uncharacterized protein